MSTTVDKKVYSWFPRRINYDCTWRPISCSILPASFAEVLLPLLEHGTSSELEGWSTGVVDGPLSCSVPSLDVMFREFSKQ